MSDFEAYHPVNAPKRSRKQRFLDLLTPKPIAFRLPERETVIHLRPLSAGDHVKLSSMTDASPADQIVFLLTSSICDADGSLVFDADDRDALLSTVSTVDVGAIREEIKRINKLAVADEVAAEKKD